MKKTRSHIKDLLDSFITDKQITGILFDTLLALSEEDREVIGDQLDAAPVPAFIPGTSGQFDHAIKQLCSSVIFEDGSRLTRQEARRLIVCWRELSMLRKEIASRC